MRILIDTHVFLWAILEPQRLSASMKRELSDSDNELVMSTISAWEVGMKYALKKLPLKVPPDVLIPQQMRILGVVALPVLLNHALGAHTLGQHHRDPFDRIIIAQGQIEGLPIMTADPQFRHYPVKLLS